jgi:hypothetical protein
VCARDPLGDRKSEAGPVYFAARGIGAQETVEDTGQQSLGDTDAAVTDGEGRLRVVGRQIDYDASRGGRVLDGVVEQDGYQAAQAGAVAADPRGAARVDGDGLLLRFRERPQALHCVRDELRQFHGFEYDLSVTGVRACQGQHVFE